MASQLTTKTETAKLAQMFKSFDKNGDGRLDKKEIQEGYAQYHGHVITDEEILSIFGQIDADGSGYIDYTEFVAASMNMTTLLSDSKLDRAFKMFDHNNSGKIDATEIRKVLGLTDNKQMNDKIKEIIS